MDLHEYAAAFLLVIPASAGFITASFATELIKKTQAGQMPGMLGLIIVLVFVTAANVLAFVQAKKVWRADEDWCQLGYGRSVWQVLVVTAYVLGIGCHLAVMLTI